jgi:salicylate biosynthesis isochorismate synthase
VPSLRRRAREGCMSAALEEARPTAVDMTTLERGLLDALEKSTTARMLMVAVPAPVRPSETLLAKSQGPALAWAAPSGFEIAALGEAASLEGRGAERFDDVARLGTEVLFGVRSVGLFGMDPVPARLYGGFAFRSGAPRTSHWAPFGEARFVLPELGYVVESGRARLFVAMSTERLAERAERVELVARALAAFETLERRFPQTSADQSSPATVDQGPIEEWTRLVEAIGDEIARGALEKVVLARRVAVDLRGPLDPAEVLARLRALAPECTRFLVRREGAVFLGATPERLAKRSGSSLETEAVAGSISTLDREAARHLFESSKDLAEHAFVVREIVRALEPLAARIDEPDRPELHELRHVLHLRTRIEAALKGKPHLLEVVERLHPTPAVGGAPTARALEWIAAHERDERGWYAGPIGWFDLGGNGEMAVALRSGVLEGSRAHLFVGAGIVEHSVAETELAETRWKLQTLLAALGIRGA